MSISGIYFLTLILFLITPDLCVFLGYLKCPQSKNTKKTQKTLNTKYTQNTQNSLNTQNTQNTKNTQTTQNSENTEIIKTNFLKLNSVAKTEFSD